MVADGVEAAPAGGSIRLPVQLDWILRWGQLGGAWGRGDVTDSLFGLDFGDVNNNRVFIGGGQLGFNYQFRLWGSRL
jgi:hypothetical protein